MIALTRAFSNHFSLLFSNILDFHRLRLQWFAHAILANIKIAFFAKMQSICLFPTKMALSFWLKNSQAKFMLIVASIKWFRSTLKTKIDSIFFAIHTSKLYALRFPAWIASIIPVLMTSYIDQYMIVLTFHYNGSLFIWCYSFTIINTIFTKIYITFLIIAYRWLVFSASHAKFGMRM